jgi:ATP-dependent helicase HrpA/adenine-specific DNA-methyltransferase
MLEDATSLAFSLAALHQFDFLCGQPVKLIHQRVYLPVGGGDGVVQRGLFRFRCATAGTFPLPATKERGEGQGEGLACNRGFSILAPMNPTANARRLRREQTDGEKELWRALRAGRFAGFKFRRQHPAGKYYLDFYCPAARLSVELDGFQHGLPEQRQRDQVREQFLAALDIEELRFWNSQWRSNREGVLLEIWHALHRRTGCVKVMRKIQNHRFMPPDPAQMTPKPPKP